MTPAAFILMDVLLVSSQQTGAQLCLASSAASPKLNHLLSFSFFWKPLAKFLLHTPTHWPSPPADISARGAGGGGEGGFHIWNALSHFDPSAVPETDPQIMRSHLIVASLNHSHNKVAPLQSLLHHGSPAQECDFSFNYNDSKGPLFWNHNPTIRQDDVMWLQNDRAAIYADRPAWIIPHQRKSWEDPRRNARKTLKESFSRCRLKPAQVSLWHLRNTPSSAFIRSHDLMNKNERY